jgi:hypothetical protein
MVCNDRQLTPAQIEAGFANQRTGVMRAVRPFSGEATPENLVDYLNREVFPALKQGREKLNEIFLQVADNAPSGNPLSYYFSTETGAADPTAGRIRLNQAVQDTATIVRVSQSNGRLIDVAPWLDVMNGGVTVPLGVVTLTDAINPGVFVRFDLNTMTDQGDYWDLGVTPVESSHDNPFVDGGAVVLGFIPGVSGAGSTVSVSALADVTGPTILGLETGVGPPEGLTGGEAGHLIKKPNVISASITASQNDFSPTGLSTADTVNIDAGVTPGNLNLTGIDASVFAELAGTELVVRYIGIGTLTLSAGDASSLSANRFLSVGSFFPVVLDNGQTASLRYCTILGLSGWLILPHSPMLSGSTMGNRIRKANTLTPNLAASTHNWSPSGLVDAHAIYVTLTGSQTLTGIDSTVFQANGNLAVGRELILANTDTTDTLTLSAGDPASLSGNRFANLLSGTVVRISPGGAVLLRREAPETTGTWRCIEFTCLAPAKSVMGNPVATLTESPRPIVSTAARQALMVNSANNAIAWRAFELADLPTQAADSFLGNITTGSAVPVAVPLADVDSTSVIYDATSHTFQRAALTGAITAAQNSNTTAFGSIAADSFIANWQPAPGVPTAVGFADIDSASVVYDSGTGTFRRAALTGAITALIDTNATLFDSGASGAGLTGGGTAILAVGAGTRITVNANDVQLATGAAESFLMNATSGTATADYRAGSSVAGAGLTYTAGGTLAVGAGDGISVNANDVAVNRDTSRHGEVTSSGVGFSKSRRRHYFFEDFDFVLNSSSAATFGESNWTWAGTGDVATFAFLTGEVGHPGIARATTNTTALDGFLLYKGFTPDSGWFAASEIYSFECVARLGSASSVFFEIGVSDDIDGSFSNGAVFLFDTSLDTTVYAYTENGGTPTSTDTGVAPGTGWNVYTIIQESDAIGTFDFYIDDVLEASISTNVPTSADFLNCGVRFLTRTGAAKTLDIDYISFESHDLGLRTS